MAILPEATRLWSFCFWLFCSSQDPIAIARKGADPTWMKGVDWRHPRLMDSEWGGWVRRGAHGRLQSMVVKNSGKWRVLLFLFLFLACVLFSLFCSGAYAICERRQRPGAGRAAGREGQGARGGSEAEARSGIE